MLGEFLCFSVSKSEHSCYTKLKYWEPIKWLEPEGCFVCAAKMYLEFMVFGDANALVHRLVLK